MNNSAINDLQSALSDMSRAVSDWQELLLQEAVRRGVNPCRVYFDEGWTPREMPSKLQPLPHPYVVRYDVLLRVADHCRARWTRGDRP